jgi:hypothetical protein
MDGIDFSRARKRSSDLSNRLRKATGQHEPLPESPKQDF